MANGEGKDNFQNAFLKVLRYASETIQREEAFVWAEEPLRCLGMDWYQAQTINQAWEALQTSRKNFNTLSPRGRALLVGLAVFLSETAPFICLTSEYRSAEDINKLLLDKHVITDRLRHHFLIEWMNADLESERISMPKNLAEPGIKTKQQITKRWIDELLPTALHFVLVESGFRISFALTKELLKNRGDRVRAGTILNSRQDALIEKIPGIMDTVKASLKGKIEKILDEADPRRREQFKPEVDDVCEIIKGYLYQLEDEESQGPKTDQIPVPGPIRHLDETDKQTAGSENGKHSGIDDAEESSKRLRASLRDWFKRRISKKAERDVTTINRVIDQSLHNGNGLDGTRPKSRSDFSGWLDQWLKGLTKWDLHFELAQNGDLADKQRNLIEEYAFERFMEDIKAKGVDPKEAKKQLEAMFGTKQTSDVENYMISRLIERL